MDFETLASQFVRNNAKARSLSNEWSSSLLQAMTSENDELLRGIIDEFDRAAKGDASEAPGQAGANSSVDDSGGVQLAQGFAETASGE